MTAASVDGPAGHDVGDLVEVIPQGGNLAFAAPALAQVAPRGGDYVGPGKVVAGDLGGELIEVGGIGWAVVNGDIDPIDHHYVERPGEAAKSGRGRVLNANTGAAIAAEGLYRHTR